MSNKSMAQMCIDNAPEGPARQKHKEHFAGGIYEPRPSHFSAVWPTVRTETFVEMVFCSIQKRGCATQDDIVIDTGLDETTVGTALADLLLWKKQVGSEVKDEGRVIVREYFVK